MHVGTLPRSGVPAPKLLAAVLKNWGTQIEETTGRDWEAKTWNPSWLTARIQEFRHTLLGAVSFA